MSKNNRSLALLLGTSVGFTALAVAIFLYARSHTDGGPVRSAEIALGEAREKIQQIEEQLARQRQAS